MSETTAAEAKQTSPAFIECCLVLSTISAVLGYVKRMLARADQLMITRLEDDQSDEQGEIGGMLFSAASWDALQTELSHCGGHLQEGDLRCLPRIARLLEIAAARLSLCQSEFELRVFEQQMLTFLLEQVRTVISAIESGRVQMRSEPTEPMVAFIATAPMVTWQEQVRRYWPLWTGFGLVALLTVLLYCIRFLIS